MNNEQRPLVAEDEEEITLYIRDRRRAKQYIVDNLVMDHWFPIIGETGYAIYSLLVRMSHSEEEKASVGFSTICEHLGVDSNGADAPQLSRATVMYYISLLEHCALIYRDKPETIVVNPATGEQTAKRQGNRSNTYYVLDVQEVTRESLDTIRAAIGSDAGISAKYRRIFNGRIARWKSIQQVWSGSRRRRIKTVVGQQALFNDNAAGDPPKYDPQYGGPR